MDIHLTGVWALTHIVGQAQHRELQCSIILALIMFYFEDEPFDFLKISDRTLIRVEQVVEILNLKFIFRLVILHLNMTCKTTLQRHFYFNFYNKLKNTIVLY